MRHLLVALLMPLLAQGQEPRTVSCRFLGFQTGDSMDSLICITEGSQVVCPLGTSEISGPANLVAVNNVLSFIDSKDRKPACNVTVPAGMHQPLIVFMPNAQGAATPLRGFAIEDSKKSFPDGGALVVNLHSTNIRFVIGEHKYMLKPGDSCGVEEPKQRDDFNMATVTFEFSHNEEWINASESRFRFTEGLRYLIFTYTDPSSQRPRVSTYQDLPYKAPAAPTKPQ